MTRDPTEPAIHAALEALIEPGDEVVVLHSSLYAFRIPEAGLKWPLLAAVRRLIASGRTLAVPAFTFAYCGDGRFDAATSEPETGALARWLLELEEFRRTSHPIYSFAVAGAKAAEIMACRSETTFGPSSPFGLFDRLPTRLVMLGCGWEVCTQFHHYEEEAGVPYRHFKTFEGVSGDGAELAVRMFVRDRWIAAENDFTPAVEALRDDGRIGRATLGEGAVEAVAARDLAAVCRDLLSKDAFAFVKDPSRVRSRVRLAAERREAPPLKVAILGSANTDLVRDAVHRHVSELLPARRVETYAPAFGQAWREAMQAGSGLDAFDPDHVFFIDRLEDLQDAGPGAVHALDEERLARHCDAVAAVAARPRAQVFVNRFAELDRGGGAAGEAARLVARANAVLGERTGACANVHLFDLANAAAAFGGEAATDPRLWFLGRLPFGRGFTEEIARHYAGLVAAATGATARLLVLDLDDTLWGGILGEDGPEGLALGGDFPGNAYRHFQTVLKQLSARGIALAVASKNDEAEALSVINSHPDMVIREADLASWRIGWQDKADSVVEIAEELGLGLANVAFIDDNPAERARMRAALPEVTVIELPDDPTGFAHAVVTSPRLACLTLTGEDRKRAESYGRARRMRAERRRFDSEDAFLASLEPRVHVASLAPGNANRAAQLVAKTNQFNTTVRRLTLDELRALDADGASVFVIGLEDRFSDFENIGVCVVHWDRPSDGDAEIDPFLLSCRILGRGVETGVLAWLASHARARGMRRLVGPVAQAPRNAPARGVFEKHGFARGDDPATWSFDLARNALTAPEWIEIVDATRGADHA